MSINGGIFLNKKVILTGVSGQDSSFLAELLLSKGYEIYGLDRRKADASRPNIKHLLDEENFKIVNGDMLEESRLISLIKTIRPDEVYHLASQSFVKASWDVPIYTCDVNAMGTIRLLEAVRIGYPAAKFCHASSSEIFGLAQEFPQNEMTYHYPRSPYACSKSFAHNITRNYRESYNLFCCNIVSFNHESERRGLEFVTRKITHAAAKIKLGLQEKLVLGNLNAKRDWGYSPDFVEAMYMMLQQDKPDDYVIATGQSHSVREFVELAFNEVDIGIRWKGDGVNETGVHNNKTIVEVSQEFYRPAEVEILRGDASKARKRLGWKPKTSFEDMIKIMVRHDMEVLKKEI